jgi:molecular chaperone DnaK
MLYLGIDLGTTFSLAAYVNATGVPALFPDRFDASSFRTPSVVHIGRDGCYVGEAVEALLQENPDVIHTRFVKLAMGENRCFKDGQDREWRPEAISALILKKLLMDVQTFTADPIGGAVITVPANFSNAQRQATRQAALLAGLPRPLLIEEPIAAATFYGLADIQGDQTLFVYDLGGGTFDATLLQASKDGLYALATEGKHDLGGKTIDEAIMQQLATEYQRQFGQDPREDSTALVQLRRFATETKLELCQPGRGQVRKSILLLGRPVDFLLTTLQFNRLIDKLVNETIAVCERCLAQAGMQWSFVDQVLLTGGSSLLPLVRERLAERCGRPKEALLLKQPHQAVAYGAALIAQQVFGSRKQAAALQRVNAWQLGIRVAGKDGRPAVQVMLDRNIPVPATASTTFSTTRPHQPRMVIEAVQQKGPGLEEKSLGYFIFLLPENCPTSYPIDITLAYDLEGLVTVTARNQQTSQVLKQIMDDEGSALDNELVNQKSWVDNLSINT